jgi:hypothetical protein
MAGDTEQAREIVRNKLANTELQKSQRQSWLYQQAQVELHAENPSWLVLDLALQKALAIAPRSSALLATKGAALVMRGQARDGGELLADAWRSNDGSVQDAELLAYLTIAAHKIGNADARRQFEEAFEQANRSSALAQRVRLQTQ